MLKIGDFSKLAHLTVKTLRHYARIGLLKPAWTDRFTGYRYYTLQQLPQINRILALKDLGFSLEQISGLIVENVSVKTMREMLQHKQVELEAHLKAEQKRLEMVAARLLQIEQAGGRAGSEVLVKKVPALPVATLREVVPAAEQLPERLNALVDELNNWMVRSAVIANGPWMALYPAAEYRERDIPIELAVTVEPGLISHPPKTVSRVRLMDLPAVPEMACLVHTGPVASLGQAHAELYAWMEANRRKPAGPARELYLRDTSENGPIDQVVEVQFPVEPVFLSTSQSAQYHKEHPMEPTFVNRPSLNIIGLCYHGNNQNQEIGQMWGQFNPRAHEIKAIPNSLAYGLCSMISGLPEGHFEYVAGVEVPDGAPIPEGMVLRHVAAARYAVFSHRGAASGLQETYHRIYNEWIPQSGLEVIQPGLDMEVYTDEFKDFAPDSVFYIYVPVK